MPCPHGRQRSRCKDCGGVNICDVTITADKPEAASRLRGWASQ